MLIHDKHEGWLTTCDYCDAGKVYGHTPTTYMGYTGDCHECDGSGGRWDATLADFDGETVRLNSGETVTVDGGLFWSMDGDPLRKADVDDIAAVLEGVLA